MRGRRPFHRAADNSGPVKRSKISGIPAVNDILADRALDDMVRWLDDVRDIHEQAHAQPDNAFRIIKKLFNSFPQ
jgi:hypothetical protein